jgi:S1-C subfamily serine protease
MPGAAPAATAEAAVTPSPSATPAPASRPPGAWRAWAARWQRSLLVVTGAAAMLALVALHAWLRPAVPVPTPEDIESVVLRTLETAELPSRAAKAYEVIRPSVVRVRGFDDEKDSGDEEEEQGVGSGVVIVENGMILTNLHVVSSAKRVKVVFHDGTESPATVIGTHPDQDLAVLKAHKLPDDLFPATLRSTGDLVEGDEVVAVGFPFGIGPSVSAGVVSGLGREYRSPEGKRLLTNLIQFDAAANPGSSGGPLITMDGAVVGIVTGILNPAGQRVFVGIGFAVPIEGAASAVGIPPF